MAARATGTTPPRASRLSASDGAAARDRARPRPDAARPPVARRFWVGVFLMIFVIGLIIWGLLSEDGEEEVRTAASARPNRPRARARAVRRNALAARLDAPQEYYEEYDDMY